MKELNMGFKNFSTEAHLIAHRNQMVLVKQRLAALNCAFDWLATLREDNPNVLDAIRVARGEVAAQRVENVLGRDETLARILLEPLSGTPLGKLIRSNARQFIDENPNSLSSPPPKAA
jgi:hypothetical protein